MYWGKRRLFTLTNKNLATIWNFNAGDVLSHPQICQNPHLVTSVLQAITITGRRFLATGGWDKTISLYIENEEEMFDLYKTYEGHTADITALTSFSYGFVSGSANGELISWILDTSKPHSTAKLPNGGTVECLASTQKFIYCADQFGTLLVYSVPKLNLLTQIAAHELIVTHSITAIAIRENKMFTADSLGYVREWQIDPDSPTMTPIAMQRCGREEILSIDICHDGKFIVTTSLDMCARLWRTGDLLYVGLFNNTNKWDINDSSTWEPDQPFLKEDKHFHPPAVKSSRKSINSPGLDQIINSKKLSSGTIAARSTARFSLGSSLNNSPNKEMHKSTPDLNQPIDPDLVSRTIEEYINQHAYDEEYQPTSSPFITDPITISKRFEAPRGLPFCSRHQDLVSQVKTLMRPKTSQAKIREPERRTLKIPFKKQNTHKPYKIPVSLTL